MAFNYFGMKLKDISSKTYVFCYVLHLFYFGLAILPPSPGPGLEPSQPSQPGDPLTSTPKKCHFKREITTPTLIVSPLIRPQGRTSSTTDPTNQLTRSQQKRNGGRQVPYPPYPPYWLILTPHTHPLGGKI